MGAFIGRTRDRKSTRLNSSHSQISYSNFVFFNDTATTEIYTLSLHDALPIFHHGHKGTQPVDLKVWVVHGGLYRSDQRSEEHTSELQSQPNLVFQLCFF